MHIRPHAHAHSPKFWGLDPLSLLLQPTDFYVHNKRSKYQAAVMQVCRLVIVSSQYGRRVLFPRHHRIIAS